jgi:DNA invertase Pin-like site-specific DNA recombinase
MSDPSLAGYARVSTVDQDAELQHRALVDAGCARIWTDHASGAQRDRPQWSALTEQLRPGDTVVVWKLDRCARSLSHLVAMIENLNDRGVGIRSLTEPIDTTSSSGRLLLHIIGAMAEFERDLIRERTKAGMGAARASGRLVGRPATMSVERVAEARRMLHSGTSKAGVARVLGVSRSTLYRALDADAPATEQSVLP